MPRFSTISYFYRLLTSVLFLALLTPAFGQKAETITITVEPGRSVRDISQKYLGNPDYWTDILQANNISSAAEVNPGMTIVIPVTAIKRAIGKLDEAQAEFQSASKAGARIFASAEIDSGFALYEEASRQRRLGDWNKSYEMAKTALTVFKKASEICLKKKDVPGQANLHYRVGNVESKKQAETLWLDAKLGSILIEGEKVRTLSRSLAEILFRDESRLRLEENSQALIQEMRTNLLEKKNKSTVSLINGDLYALLGGQGGGQQFNLSVPGVETEIKSTTFRVGRDDKKASFANYEGELAIAAAGEKVVLKENQGSIVPHNEKPTPPRDLLPPVKLTEPGDGAEIYSLTTALRWETVTGAALYQIEIANERSFSQIIFSEKLPANSLKSLPQLTAGINYWRVMARDKDGLAGTYSSIRSFIIVKDDAPPYLIVRNPAEGQLVTSADLTVSGETEAGVKLTVGGTAVTVGADGKFTAKVTLREGGNDIIIVAKDNAGNETKLVRKVVYQAGGSFRLEFDQNLLQEKPGVFLVNSKSISLSGVSNPGYSLNIKDQTGAYSADALAGSNGKFAFNIPLSASENTFRIIVKSPAGETQTYDIAIKFDDAPPEIFLHQALPEITGNKTLQLTGKVEGGDYLQIKGKAAPVSAGEFSAEVELSPGENMLTITASDAAGNHSTVRKAVFLDQQPPELLRTEITPMKVTGGEQIQIFIYAKDISPLKKTAVYAIKAGDFFYQGYLKYSSGAGRYEGTAGIPEGVAGAVKLESVTLQDAQGNEKTYKY